MNVSQIRAERNARLQESDKYIISDYPHPSTRARMQWMEYRQKLRDMMVDVVIQSEGDPEALLIVLWPTKPSE